MGGHKLLSATATFFIALFLSGIGGPPARAATLLARAAAPAAPTITEPSGEGQLLSAADVHMETAPFQDNDSGDKHRCSDWEIWTVSPAAVERVWFAGCISGVQKVHCHLDDGVYQNSHAGRRELLADTDYELRSVTATTAAIPPRSGAHTPSGRSAPTPTASRYRVPRIGA